jgi:hypothetical protein
MRDVPFQKYRADGWIMPNIFNETASAIAKKNSCIFDCKELRRYRAEASGIDGGVRWESDASVWETPGMC